MLKRPYRLNPETQVWSRQAYQSIDYSDGQEIEAYLKSALDNSQDLSVLSPELRQYCRDWPSAYHLASERCNLLRPFKLSGNILEIGAGCGALTRYLGETGANILALEGTLPRAKLARLRTRDLDNVTVLAEKFDDFSCDQQFDWVTLIGVLEYASLFSREANPHLALLKRAKQWLKPNGKLILAIENQLGLKYFAGAPEDHLGEAMIGLEGRYLPHGVRTFGRHDLAELLQQSGYDGSDWLVPCPDYKFPVSIITESGFKDQDFDASSLVWQASYRDPQLPLDTHFSLPLTWPVICNNQLGLDLASSFLVVAGSESDTNNSELAYYYSMNRLPEYCKQNIFVKTPQGIKVQNHDYIPGQLLSFEFWKIIANKNWQFNDLKNYFIKYRDILLVMIGSRKHSISGEYLDALPHNIILNHNKPILFDKEWDLYQTIDFDYVLYRAALSIVAMLAKSPTRHPDLVGSTDEFIAKLADITQVQVKTYAQQERDLQLKVYGRVDFPAENFLRRASAAEEIHQQLMRERDGLIQSLKEHQASISWRITKPLRKLRQLF